jgi:hypothetical protein
MYQGARGVSGMASVGRGRGICKLAVLCISLHVISNGRGSILARIRRCLAGYITISFAFV